MKKILIVDDEQDIVESLKFVLEVSGYVCYTAFNGEDGLRLAKEIMPDLIILDVMMPKINGYKISRLLKYDSKYKDIPIIMVTARSQLEDKMIGEETGADEYITKPFELPEVLARIQVQLRHAGRETGSGRLAYKDLVLDKTNYQVKIGGREIPRITKQEFAILELLVSHPRQVFSKEDIFSYAWEEPYMGETKTLDVHISNIRKKLKAVTSEEYIETVWGIGYRLHG